MSVDPTVTDELLAYIEAEAEKADADLSKLPESCQPLWYRRHKAAQKDS